MHAGFEGGLGDGDIEIERTGADHHVLALEGGTQRGRILDIDRREGDAVGLGQFEAAGIAVGQGHLIGAGRCEIDGDGGADMAGAENEGFGHRISSPETKLSHGGGFSLSE